MFLPSSALLLCLLGPVLPTPWLLALAQEEDDDDGGGEEEMAKPKSKKKSAAALPKDDAPAAMAGEVPDAPLYTEADSGYVWFFLLLFALCLYLVHKAYQRQRNSTSSGGTKARARMEEFTKMQSSFLVAYAFCVSADWMQGPYVFKLYAFYGLSKSEIGMLFIAGFLSSLFFGTALAGLADGWGRKRICLVYCLLSALSCASKHSKEYTHLLFGRVLAGVATSLLHSGFESYYVSSYQAHGSLLQSPLMDTLRAMSFIRGMMAIAMAVLSNALVSRFGLVAPFDCSLVLLALGAAVIATRWKENYGDRAAGESFSSALTSLTTNARISLLGLIQSCFEGAMYIFVFTWAPLLEHAGASATESGDAIPHSLIFCTFMLCVMMGAIGYHHKRAPGAEPATATATTMMARVEEEQSAGQIACGAALLSMLVIAFLFNASYPLVFLACCLFEAAVGLYFPAMAAQRARHLPSEARATLLGLFRVPINVIAILVLLNAQELGTHRLIMTSTALLAFALLGQRTLMGLAPPILGDGSSNSIGGKDSEDEEARGVET